MATFFENWPVYGVFLFLTLFLACPVIFRYATSRPINKDGWFLLAFAALFALLATGSGFALKIGENTVIFEQKKAIEEQQKTIKETKAQTFVLENQLTKAKKDVQQKETLLAALNQRLESSSSERRNKETLLARVIQERDTARQDLLARESNLSNLREQLQQARSASLAKDEQLAQFKSQSDALQRKLAEQHRQIEILTAGVKNQTPTPQVK